MWSLLIPFSHVFQIQLMDFLEQFGLTISTDSGALMFVFVCICSMKDVQYLTHHGLNHGQVNKSTIEDFKLIDKNNNLLEISNGCMD